MCVCVYIYTQLINVCIRLYRFGHALAVKGFLHPLSVVQHVLYELCGMQAAVSRVGARYDGW